MQRYLLPAFLFSLDALILVFSSWLSMIVRFPEQDAQYAFYTPAFTLNLPVMLCCYLLCYVCFHLHQRIWQYAGPREIVQIVVAKNAGGSGAVAKIVAARTLGLPVVMIDRPALPPRAVVGAVDAVLDWLHADLGV